MYYKPSKSGWLVFLWYETWLPLRCGDVFADETWLPLRSAEPRGAQAKSADR